MKFIPGHLQIKSHDEEMYRCWVSDIQRYRGVKLIENEANDFASELLLPEADIQSIVKKRQVPRPGLLTLKYSRSGGPD